MTTSESVAVLQLELFDPFDDGLTFGEWVESLPLDPAETKPVFQSGRPDPHSRQIFSPRRDSR